MTKEQKTKYGVLLGVTFGYGLFYVCRLSMNVLKKPLVDAGILTPTQLGILGLIAAWAYAFGKFCNGFMADRVNVKYFMAIALSVCALCNFFLGFNIPFTIFAILWGLNSWFQSAGAPCSIISLRRWFGKEQFGSMYGLWSSSHNIGEALANIVIAAIISSSLAQLFTKVQLGFSSAAIMGVIGVVIILLLVKTKKISSEENVSASDKQKNIGKQQLSILKIPIIWVLALASAFMYISRYAVINWGIYYLESSKAYADDGLLAGTVIGINSIVGIVSTMGSGFLSDKLFHGSRYELAIIASVLNVVALSLFLFIPAGYVWADIVSMVLFGLSIGLLLCFVGGLMAVDLAPVEAAGAAAGVVGFSSYLLEGVGEFVAGKLIEGREMLDSAGQVVLDEIGQPKMVYSFGDSVRIFWIGAATCSLLLLVVIYVRQQRRKKLVQA